LAIYTKTGDGGSTSLFDGKRVKKYDLRVETYGTFDELNAHISLCEKYVTSDQNKACLNRTQELLFCVGAELATEDIIKHKQLTLVTSQDSLVLEKAIDSYQEQLPKVTEFIKPGKSKGAAYLHVARAVSRRGERLLVKLAQEIEVREELLIYVNRLSDFLYAMAREEDFRYDVNRTTQAVLERYQRENQLEINSQVKANIQVETSNQAKIKESSVKNHGIFSLEFCGELARAVETAAKKHVPVTMAIVNKEGLLIYQYHMPDALLVSVDVAKKKAYTVVAMKAATHELASLTKPGAPFHQLETVSDGTIVTYGGGVPIVNSKGEILGALGISGGSEEQDITIAQEALAQVVIN
jgi:ATP:cob(I)alamin adenosyltransferase